MQYLLITMSGKVLAFLFGLLLLKRLPLAYKFIWIQILIAIACEAYGYYLGILHHKRNVWLFNYYWLIGELWILGSAGILLNGKKIFRNIGIMLVAISTVIWVANMISNGIQSYEPWVILTIYSSLIYIYLVLLLNNVLFNKTALLNNPHFWVCISSLLFFCCNIPYLGMYNYLHDNSPQLLKNLFSITLALNFIRYPLLIIAFYFIWKIPKGSFLKT
jgi:hypothetical protein